MVPQRRTASLQLSELITNHPFCTFFTSLHTFGLLSSMLQGDLNYDTMKDLLGDGIFAVDGARWRHQRKLASYEFSTRILREFSSVEFRQTAARLAEKIEDAARDAAAVDLQVRIGWVWCELDTLSGTDEAGVAFSKPSMNRTIIFLRFADIFWKVKRRFNID
ncbi:hypothetical protein HPP92_001343 [Vanilla planifolia]|uniref:Cytochrome P450 n=1 Tax=Vanilla planifolia TaxID=51239 RepID=A0A835S7I4_VANPL|nr:hypothetical protein HPP92_001343 [Vanilla planifolia]